MEPESSICLGDLVAQNIQKLLPTEAPNPYQSLLCHRGEVSPSCAPTFPNSPVLPCLGFLWPHEKRMAYEKPADILDISRSMFKYPWLEYPERTKGEIGIDRNRVKVGLEKKSSLAL